MENGLGESLGGLGTGNQGAGIKISSQSEICLALDLISSAHWAKIKTGRWLPFIL